mmetsp:Transcript_31365/g.100090  ORF Transcript_31365/g.100090 Transcript_31365/m.100090 type:complete len:221 (+) Transcript_31365:875-1537(+)
MRAVGGGGDCVPPGAARGVALAAHRGVPRGGAEQSPRGAVLQLRIRHLRAQLDEREAGRRARGQGRLRLHGPLLPHLHRHGRLGGAHLRVRGERGGPRHARAPGAGPRVLGRAPLRRGLPLCGEHERHPRLLDRGALQPPRERRVLQGVGHLLVLGPPLGARPRALRGERPRLRHHLARGVRDGGGQLPHPAPRIHQGRQVARARAAKAAPAPHCYAAAG